jgi:hypothetical protein
MTTGTLLQNEVIQKAWQDPSFKAMLLENPKKVLQEVLGVILPDHITVKAVEENSDEIYFVLPQNPSEVLKSEVKPQSVWGV